MPLRTDLVPPEGNAFEQYLQIMEYVYKVPREKASAGISNERFIVGAFDEEKLVGFVLFRDHKKSLLNPEHAFVAYEELVSIWSGIALNQTGQALVIIAMTIVVYEILSLTTSAILNFYNYRIQLVER